MTMPMWRKGNSTTTVNPLSPCGLEYADKSDKITVMSIGLNRSLHSVCSALWNSRVLSTRNDSTCG